MLHYWAITPKIGARSDRLFSAESRRAVVLDVGADEGVLDMDGDRNHRRATLQ